MKIRLSQKPAGAIIIVIAIVVAMIFIVGIGGLIIGKCIENAEKYKANRDHQLTNEIEGFSAQMLEDYIRQTGDTNAKARISLATNLMVISDGVPQGGNLQWSVDLSTWHDFEGVQSITVDWITEVARAPGAEPKMFFRIK